MSSFITNPFDFSLSASKITEIAKKSIEKSKQLYDKIEKFKPEECTFESVMNPLLDDENVFEFYETNCSFPNYVHPDEEKRKAATKNSEMFSNFSIETMSREGLYHAINNVKKNKKEFDSLNYIQKRAVNRMLRDFERNGFGLEKEKREKLKIIQKKISLNKIDFSQNLINDKTTIPFTKEQLEGCSEDFITSLEKTTETTKDGKKIEKFIVPMKSPSITHILDNCKIRETRKHLFIIKDRRCMKDNSKILEETVQLKFQEAKLLGFKSHADYKLNIKMAKKEENVSKFLFDLMNKTLPCAKKEIETFLKLFNEVDAKKNEKIEQIYYWDIFYLMKLYKKKYFDLDEEFIKKFFPLSETFDKILKLFQTIYGLKFKEQKFDGKETEKFRWHEEVRLFNVYESETNKFIGQFYLDLFPRNGKYQHQAAFGMTSGFQFLTDECAKENGKKKGEKQFPIVAMVGNFTKPTKDKPSFLSHSQLTTLLHEFGHLTHFLCSKSIYARFASFATENDFVELPSQFQENFAWEKETLKNFASKHFVTNETLNDELVEKMIKAKNVGISVKTLRQLFYGIFDFTLFGTVKTPFSEIEEVKHFYKNKEFKKGSPSIGDVYSKLRELITLIPHDNSKEAINSCGASQFGHIMGGYSCGYYGYLWSEVISDDCFSFLKKNKNQLKDGESLFDINMSKKFRKIVLETANQKDGEEIVKNFLGREVSNKAFIEKIFGKSEIKE